MSAATPASRLVERFRADCGALALPPTERSPLAVAVSGGPDSMAMLALAATAFPGTVTAATVDHGLRREAKEEAALVARRCEAIGVPHATLAGTAGSRSQADARTLRYRLLQCWAVEQGARALATAHHADDQAETFLMRAARASGVGGLAGIRAQRDVGVGFDVVKPASDVGSMQDTYTLRIVRPLLGWRRAELAAIVGALGWVIVDDPSNRDPHHDRTRMRALLDREAAALPAERLAASAVWCAEADETLRAVATWLWRDRQRMPVGVDNPGCETWLVIGDLPRGLQRRLAQAAIANVRSVNGVIRPGFHTDSANVEPLLDALAAGRRVTHAGVLASPSAGGVWRFREAPPRRSPGRTD